MAKKKIKLPDINSKPKYTIELDEEQLYSLGGWLKENAGNLLQTAAGAGAMLIPGAQGVGLGLMASGVGGIAGNALADDPETIDYSQETRMPRTVGKQNMTPNVMSFSNGGKIKTVMDEWDKGKLNIGKSNKKVPDTKQGQKQAIAIALSYNKKGLGGPTDISKPKRSITTVTKPNWRPLTDLEFVQSTGIDKDEFFKTSPEERIKFVPNSMFKVIKGKKGSTANQGGMQYFQNVPTNIGTSISENSIVTLKNPGLAYIKKNFPNHPIYAMGGEFDNEYNGDQKLMQLEGPKHDEGGIQFTPDAELEGGETVYKDVVNSDQIKITKDIASKYGLPKTAINKTVADYSKLIEKNYKDRDLDPFAQTSKEMELNNLAKMSTDLAELYKPQMNEMGKGGKLKYVNGNTNGPGFPPIFNPEKFNQWKKQLRNQPELGWGTPEEGERWFPFQNENTKEPGYYSGVNLPVPITGNQNKIVKSDNRTVFEIPEGISYKKPVSSNVNNNSQVQQYKLPDLSYKAPSDYMDIKPELGSLIDNNQSNIKFSNPLDDPNSSLFNPTKSKADTLGANTQKSNIGISSILGAIPAAVSAYQTARTAKEGYDKVKLGRVHAEDYNPSFIDPKYQLDQVSDTFNTANESMEQQSRTDYLRRRIQSATEESKTKSGILGQVQGVNTQMLNQAKQINQQNKISADRTNLQMQMQEENINAANKGTYQTARDYQLSNLATMAGEVGRDIKMEEANKDWLQWQKDIIPSIYGDSMNFDFSGGKRKWSGTDSLPMSNNNNNILSDYTTKPWSPLKENVYDEESLQFGPGINDYYNRVYRNTNSMTRGMRYDRSTGSYLNQ